jgi:HAD superfamily hydrolase (TIGR01450 family)
MLLAAPNRLYRGYVFDLDGTVYLSDELLPGADRVVKTLRDAGCRIVFVSNNPTYTRQQIAEKLTGLGIPASSREVVNSSHVLVRYLRERAPGCTVFPIGERPLHDELVAAGFTISEAPAAIDYVIASFDRTFEYRKLQIAFDAIRAGAHFIATNADRYCPVAGGGEPDAAAIIAAVEACTNTPVEEVVGKPSTIMARATLDVLALEPGDCLLTGDRLEVDILMGRRAGMDSALVLTGATTPAQLAESEIVPDFVVERLDQLLP